MSNKIKSPKIDQGERVKIQDTESTGPDYPVFCLKHLHNDYSVDNCDQEQRAAFALQLSKLSQLTWDNIICTGRHSLGLEKIDIKSIKAGLPNFVTEDVNHLLAFRFYKKMPFLGIRRRGTLHILYLDPKGALYDHE